VRTIFGPGLDFGCSVPEEGKKTCL